MNIWHLHALRVRYQETDQMKVVYHANYLNWFEIGRTEWIRHIGIAYRDIERKGLLLPLTHLEAEFLQPASYDDWVTVCTCLSDMSAVRVRFESRIIAGDLVSTCGLTLEADEPPGPVLVKGATQHVWVNEAWKPVRFDREAPQWYEAMKASIRGRPDAGGIP